MTLQVPEAAVYWTALLRFDMGLEGEALPCIIAWLSEKSEERIADYISTRPILLRQT